ncbi:MAG: isoprenylcysteine carboxylmethyltransferase family protein [Gemmatimonadetes bacterium]|nr:isoprenylcysteine carboxylmethyltransferase family protein [Gemmatimonadota bacterium]
MPDIEIVFRIFMPLFMTVFVLVTYTANVAAFRKRYGIDPRVTGPSDPVLYLCQVYRDVIMIALFAIVFVYAVAPRIYAFLIPIPYLEIPMLRFTGAAAMIAGACVLRLAQHQLGPAWRIGIDRSGTPTDLVTTGLYGVSRNPIALGMCTIAVGIFLALPNVLTFAIASQAVMLFQIRIRIEEEHLGQQHGAAYEAYSQSTPRWI